MKYETPEITTLTAAINAIQAPHPQDKGVTGPIDSLLENETFGAYADWE
jgi:hypothetical protein